MDDENNSLLYLHDQSLCTTSMRFTNAATKYASCIYIQDKCAIISVINNDKGWFCRFDVITFLIGNKTELYGQACSLQMIDKG